MERQLDAKFHDKWMDGWTDEWIDGSGYLSPEW